MRPDPHAGKVAGLGCGCAACLEPMPDPEFGAPEIHAERRDAYERKRRGITHELGLDVSDSIRAPGQHAKKEDGEHG